MIHLIVCWVLNIYSLIVDGIKTATYVHSSQCSVMLIRKFVSGV